MQNTTTEAVRVLGGAGGQWPQASAGTEANLNVMIVESRGGDLEMALAQIPGEGEKEDKRT